MYKKKIVKCKQHGSRSSCELFVTLALILKKTLKLYGPFLWMGFNCLKARATSRRQFTFYHWVPRYMEKIASGDLKTRSHWGVVQIYQWELLAVCPHPEKFSDHRHCDSGDVFNLPRDTCLKGYVKLWVKSPHGKSPPCHVWCPLV